MTRTKATISDTRSRVQARWIAPVRQPGILVVFVAVCLAPGLAHAGSIVLNSAGELTETMMQAQALDAFFLDTQYPFTSPLSVTYSVDPGAQTFSYSLQAGQTINGLPVSDSATGSGDYSSGLYEWTSTLAAGSASFLTAYSETWDVGTGSGFSGTINISSLLRWSITGTEDVLSSGEHSTTYFDDGEASVQVQALQHGQWVNVGDPFTVNEYSFLYPGDEWRVRVYRNQNAVTVSHSGIWKEVPRTAPEPSSLALLGPAGILSLLAYELRRRRRRRWQL
ncbi:MAG: hypothetical protein ABSC95_11840 [Acetobacteraceae bacterium]